MDKGELKASVIHEIGARTDDLLESAKIEVYRHEGGISALLGTTKKVAELGVQVDRDLDAGAFGDLDGPLAIAGAVKKYIQRALAVVESEMKSADNHRLICQGRVQALQLMVGNMKKLHDSEIEKSRQRAQVEAGATPNGHVVGVAPGVSIKERRLAEEKAVTAPSKPKRVPSKRRSRKSNGAHA